MISIRLFVLGACLCIMLASSFFLQSCFVFLCFFRVSKMFLVGLANVVRLCFTSDIVLLIDWLYCIDLFSCIAASLFNKLRGLLYFTLLYGVTPLFPVGSWRFLICYYSQMLFIYLFSIKSYTNWCRTSNLAWLINGNVHWTEYDTNNELVHKVSGGGETICPPRRWQFDGGIYRFAANRKSRRIYVRPRTGPQSAHGGRRWLDCRQPACL